MTAALRLLLTASALALSVASCGQKGPLVLPEDEARAPDARGAASALCLAHGRSADGVTPRV